MRASAQIVSRRVRRGGRIIVKVYRATGIVTIKLRRGGRLVRIVRTTIRGGRALAGTQRLRRGDYKVSVTYRGRTLTNRTVTVR